MFCTAHPILCSDKMERNEMGGARNGYGRGEVNTECWWGNLWERDDRGDPGVDV